MSRYINERAAYAQVVQLVGDYECLIKEFQNPDVEEIGNYKVLRVLSEGPFGVVYLAQHKMLHYKVVLKKGERDLSKNGDNIMRECYYLREFNHPHITKIFETIFTENYVYMSIEYCCQGDLFDYLSKRRQIPTEEAVKIFSQLCGSVHYIHKRGCCHRDLKLENILLDEDNNVKLSDLGFTREIPHFYPNGNSAPNPHSPLHTFCGTTVYMAPELIRREQYSGIRTDLWALGIILFTMLYGEMPFDTEDEILEQEPVYKDFISPSIIDFLKTLLKKDAKERFDSLEVVLQAPALQPYGEQQLQLLQDLRKQKLPDFDSPLERHLLKKIDRIGIDRKLLKKSYRNRQLDSLVGFWNILVEREKHQYHKKKRRKSRLATRSRSMLKLNSNRSMNGIGSRDRSMLSIPELLQNLQIQGPRKAAAIENANGNAMTNGTSEGPVSESSPRESDDFSYPHQNHLFRPASYSSILSNPSIKQKLSLKYWKQKLKQMKNGSKTSLNFDEKKRNPSLVDSRLDVVNPEDRSKIRDNTHFNSQLGSIPAGEPTSGYTHQRRASGSGSITKRPTSVFSAFSQFSETSGGSDYNAGYSTDNTVQNTSNITDRNPNAQPVYSRSKSNDGLFSTKSKQPDSLILESPTSNTDLSRCNSLESSSISFSSKRGRRRHNSRLPSGSVIRTRRGFDFIHRGKSPLGFYECAMFPDRNKTRVNQKPIIVEEDSSKFFEEDEEDEEGENEIPNGSQLEPPIQLIKVDDMQNLVNGVDTVGDVYEDEHDEEDDHGLEIKTTPRIHLDTRPVLRSDSKVIYDSASDSATTGDEADEEDECELEDESTVLQKDP
ncbi:hypothetical protein LJB42_003166 [Komagataella kurtzmanii]|nr:hypothetical protein LJB42_003166 [Komagataella kurtzmanii]